MNFCCSAVAGRAASSGWLPAGRGAVFTGVDCTFLPAAEKMNSQIDNLWEALSEGIESREP
jgi:hypothetical protein